MVSNWTARRPACLAPLFILQQPSCGPESSPAHPFSYLSSVDAAADAVCPTCLLRQEVEMSNRLASLFLSLSLVPAHGRTTYFCKKEFNSTKVTDVGTFFIKEMKSHWSEMLPQHSEFSVAGIFRLVATLHDERFKGRVGRPSNELLPIFSAACPSVLGAHAVQSSRAPRPSFPGQVCHESNGISGNNLRPYLSLLLLPLPLLSCKL